MILFICLFFPAVLSVWVCEGLLGTSLKGRQWGYLYTLAVLGTNMVCFMIKTYVLGTGTAALIDWTEDMLPSTAANYLIITIPVALAMGVIFFLIRKYLRITIEDLNDEDA